MVFFFVDYAREFSFVPATREAWWAFAEQRSIGSLPDSASSTAKPLRKCQCSILLFQGRRSSINQVFYIFIMPIKLLNIGKNDGFICKINNWRSIKVKHFPVARLLTERSDNQWLKPRTAHIYFLCRPTDSRSKRLEKTIDITNYRVSITNPSDAISQKGYNFKVRSQQRDNLLARLTPWSTLVDLSSDFVRREAHLLRSR